MTSEDNFFIDIISAELEFLFEANGYDPPYINSDDRKYIDPLEFIKFVDGLPDYRCANEFRIAKETKWQYEKKVEDEQIKKYLALADQAFDILSQYYYPPNYPPLVEVNTTETQKDQIINSIALPPGIPNCNISRLYLNRLVEEEYLDQEYRPAGALNTQEKRAYVIYKLKQNIDINVKKLAAWWGVNNVTQTMSNAKNNKKRYKKNIDALFEAISKERHNKLITL